jgi:hypothetical protein
MKARKSWKSVLVYECIGFGLVAALMWLDELGDLPQFLFGGSKHVHDWRDSAMATIVILCIGAIVFGLTLRLVQQLQNLENMLRMCAWCRKIGFHEKWLRVEEYFDEGFHMHTTHGMCPDCLKNVEEETRIYKKEEMEKKAMASKAEPAAAMG